MSHRHATLEITKWSSLREARAASPGLRLVNDDAEGRGPVFEFQQVTYEPDLAAAGVIGLQMDSEFGEPTVLGPEWGSRRWIGCNSDVYVLSPALGIEARISLTSRFASFYIHESTSQLIVVFETGLLALATDRRVNWRIDLDVLTDVRWSESQAFVSQMQGPDVAVDLATGLPQT